MILKKLIFYGLLFLLTFNYLKSVNSDTVGVSAQDTFGPVCDDVTVTCVPTETPAATSIPTNTPVPSETPIPSVTPTASNTPPPTPTELPRAGTPDRLLMIFMISATFIGTGLLGRKFILYR